MNIILVSMIIAAIVCPLLLKASQKEIKWQVIGILIAALIGLSLVMFFTGKAGKTLDVEILNGEVVNKLSEKVSCSHDYQCNCRSVTTCSGSGKDRTCSTSQVCDTCYEHSYDVDWTVKSNIGDSKISRVDRQGLQMPERWRQTKIGEPYSDTHLHTNYIKGVPDSIFHVTDALHTKKFANMIPEYPKEIYDYYRINRAMSVGVPVPDLQQWSDDISTILKQLGPQKQANIIVLFVNTNDPNYEFALRAAWLGGKKNDIIVVLGATEYPKIDFARVMSWTDKEIFKVKLRDELTDMETIDRVKIIESIRTLTATEFKRKSMKDFAYLDNEIDPPNWVIWLTFIIIILSPGIVGFYYKKINSSPVRFSRYSRR